MVKVANYHLRKSTREGEEKEFIVLELQGDVELVQSLQTGRYYATAKKCTISSTFNEETAKQLIGSTFPGSIVRVQRDPYEYVIPDTGETIMLSHSYEYKPEEAVVVFNEPLKLVA